jgi:SAM-dependent methyltransferase
VVALGVPLAPGDEVLDLACGDAHMAEPLLALGLRYRGVDGSREMIAEARRRLGDRVPLTVSLMEDYAPPEPVATTLILNAFWYPDDRVAFLRQVAGFTTKKLVFDFAPRLHRPAEVERDLRAAGFTLAARRPFLLPQSIRLAPPLRALLRLLERAEPLASVVLRLRGLWVYAAAPTQARA